MDWVISKLVIRDTIILIASIYERYTPSVHMLFIKKTRVRF